MRAQKDSHLLGICPGVELAMKGYKRLRDMVVYVQQNSTLEAGSEMTWRVQLQAAGESWKTGDDSELPSTRTIAFD